MAGAAATARLALDASGFNKQANASFREFSKQLTSVKDGTDVAMRGAEALQKVFVKSLGGTIAIGAASALGDAMRDVGNQIGSAGSFAMEAMSGLNGLAGSMEEGANRGAKLAAAADSVRKTLEDLKNSSPIQAGIFNLLGGDQVLQDLESSQRGLAGQELLTGLKQGNKDQVRLSQAASQGQDVLEKEQQRMANEKARRELISSKAFTGSNKATQDKILAEFEKKIVLENQVRQNLQISKYNEETQKLKEKLLKEAAQSEEDFKKTMMDRDFADAKRDRERQIQREDFQRGLDEARKKADEMTAQRNANRGQRGLRANAFTETLDVAAGMGDKNIAAEIDRARQKQADEQARANRKSFDDAVLAQTSALTADGGQRTMASRRSEFIQQMAKQENRGKSLTDIWTVLSDAISKITAAPMVGGN